MARHNVMILAAGAGNGHNRAGQALKKAFVADDRVRQAMSVDCLNYINKAFKEVYLHYFIEAVKKAPTLWGWAFDKTDVPWRDVNFREFFERINAKRLIRKVKKFRPSICVCTHFMPAVIISRLLMKNKLNTHLFSRGDRLLCSHDLDDGSVLSILRTARRRQSAVALITTWTASLQKEPPNFRSSAPWALPPRWTNG